MKASKLRQKIIIQNSITIKSPTGASRKEWSNLFSIFCSFEPLSVKDILSAQATSSKITARAMVRKREGIKSSMRVIHKGKIYQIEGSPLVDPYSGNEYMTLMLSIIE